MGPYDTEGMPSEEAAPSQPGNESEPDASNEDEAGPEGVTALLPKSICPGMDVQPGQTITLKVVKTYDDEIEVEYEKDDKPSDPSEMSQSESKLNDLAEAPPE